MSSYKTLQYTLSIHTAYIEWAIDWLTMLAMLGLALMDSNLLTTFKFFILQAIMSAVSPYYMEKET